MKILGQVAFFLLLLGSISCQNNNVNRNAKSSSNKPSRRVVSQAADTAVVQSSSSEDRPSRRVVSQAADTAVVQSSSSEDRPSRRVVSQAADTAVVQSSSSEDRPSRRVVSQAADTAVVQSSSSEDRPSRRVVSQAADTAVVQPSASEDRPSRRVVVSQAADTAVVQPSASEDRPSRRVVSQAADTTVAQPSASEDRPSRRVVSQAADTTVVQPSTSEDNSHPPRPDAARSRTEGTPEAGRPRPEAAAGTSVLPSGRESSPSVPAARSADAGRPRPSTEAGREREGTPGLSSGREGSSPVPAARPAEARREGSSPSVPAGARPEGAGGREGNQNQNPAAAAAAARPAGQQSQDMRLHFLKNTQVTCNDGTAAGFYLKEFRGSRRWILFLEGGWCCYNRESCDSRYQNIPRLMSSSAWPQTRTGSGILSSQAEENPHWHNTNIVFIPYCSSDVWSGTGPSPTPPRQRQGRDKERQRDAASGSIEYTFMGSLIIHEVIQDLIPKGIKQAKVVMLTGTSAGGTGVLLNIEKVAAQLQQLGAEAQVRGLVDSGWFLESKRQRAPGCPATVSCSPEDAIKKGLRLWNGVVPNRCRQLYKRGEEWQCFFGHRLYSTLTSPLFVVQWLFDEEQLRVENIYLGAQSMSEEQWTYMRNLGREIKSSLRDVTAVFAPSCLSHTLITKSNWQTFQVRGTSLPRALQCWDRSLQEANRATGGSATSNNRTVPKGCPFHLLDTCLSPHCNPTCPALVHQATRQELTLVQMLVAMGVDLQRLGLDPQRDDAGSLASVVVSNGG